MGSPIVELISALRHPEVRLVAPCPGWLRFPVFSGIHIGSSLGVALRSSLSSPPSPSPMSSPAPEDSVPSTPPIQDGDAPLRPPALLNLTPLGSSTRGSLTPSANAPLVPETEKVYGNGNGLEEDAIRQPERRKSLFQRPIFLFAVAAACVVVVLAVILPVYFTVIKPKDKTSSSGGGNPNSNSTNGNPNSPKGLTTGGDGSTITMDNGTQFTYRNPFGGFCTRISFS